ncbi:hypothetical protein RD792_003500 [Penstemon davidsonii]|uniref:HAT C-terminal dimerisation domain-containing protein n=1 Tax=Penstemon davidsonii TaxID=160366 RepID=A0ABR0DTZ9_9LAMI|nr:hypothetical protein RD792_003500 [Penstemon davidsonii]
MNKILYYAVIFDPHRKIAYLEFTFRELFPRTKVDGSPSYKDFVDKVTFGFEEMFNKYKKLYVNATPTSPCAKSSGSTSMGFPVYDEFDCESEMYDLDSQFERLRKGKEKLIKSELDKYLSEDCEPLVDTFDILSWWKVETHRFPILLRMARDILVVPVSTVASEAAFSTGGRFLDAFRSSCLLELPKL